MNKKFIFILFISISGCQKNYTIEPDELPYAYVNKPYKQELNIWGGKVADSSLKIKSNLPKGMVIGFAEITEDGPESYNRLKIEGIPSHKGKYIINISSKFYGGGARTLNKTYYLIVKE